MAAEETSEEQQRRITELQEERNQLRRDLDASRASNAAISSRLAEGHGDPLLAGHQQSAAAGDGRSAGLGGPVSGETDRRRSFGVMNSSASRIAAGARPYSGALTSSLKFPTNGNLNAKVAWRSRIEMHLRREGLSLVLSREAPQIPINGDGSDAIDHRYDSELVADHHRTFGILLEAVTNSPFESRIHRCSSAPEAWQMVTSCIIPQTTDEQYLLEQELEHVRYLGEEHPDLFLARVDGMLNTLSLAGIQKTEGEISRIIVRQLPDRLFNIEKRSRLMDPGLSRSQIEEIIRSAYARQRAEQLRNPSASAPAASSTAPAVQGVPHALAVGTGHFGRSNGGNSGGMGVGGVARGPPPAHQQQWSRGSTSQQQSPWNNRGWSSQQQWQQPRMRGRRPPSPPSSWHHGGHSRGYGGASSSWQPQRPPSSWQHDDGETAETPWDYRRWYDSQYRKFGPPPPQQPPPPPQQKQRPPSQQQPHPQQQQRQSQQQPQSSRSPGAQNSHVLPPRNASGKFNRGVGGIYDCDRNADYFQTESPPSIGKPQGWLHQCQRCGRVGHNAAECDAERRFEGYCSICGDWGHTARRCQLRSRRTVGGYPRANVVTTPENSFDPVSAPASASGGGFVDANGYLTPDHVDIATDSAPSSGGYIPHGSGNVEQSPGAHGEPHSDYAPSADGRRVTFAEVPHDDGEAYEYYEDGGDWNDDVEFQRQQRGRYEDNHFAAPLSLPFGGAGGSDGTVFDPGFMALQKFFSFSSSRDSSATPLSPSGSMSLLAMSVEFPALRRGAIVFLGDTGAAIHGVSSGEHVYHRRQPQPKEQYLMTANGQRIEVSYFGDLDVRFHSDAGGEDKMVTLMDVAVVPGLKYNLISFSQLQRQQAITLDETGAWLTGSKVHFSLLGNGNYIQGTRVPPGDPASSPAMAAAVIRPGKQRSMNVNDLHQALAHRNEGTIRETARQLGIKVTSLLEFCDYCAESKAFRIATSRSLPPPPLSSPLPPYCHRSYRRLCRFYWGCQVHDDDSGPLHQLRMA